jgi:dCTP deaminase
MIICVLSDVDILREIEEGNLKIDPFDKGQLKPDGLDWRLGSTVLIADPKQPNTWETVEIGESAFVFYPGKFYLCVTMERLELPNNIMAQMTGRSSLGRLGLMVHVTAGDFDAGFSGNGTSEVAVVGPWPIALQAEQNVGKFVFQYLKTPASCGYDNWPGSRYSRQAQVPIPSRFHER